MSQERPTPIEAIHDSLRAVLDTNRNVRRNLADELAGRGEIAAAWTCGDETVMQAFTSGVFALLDADGRPRSRYQPSEARIEHAIDGLVIMMNAVRSMRDGFVEGPDSAWRPSRQARERMRMVVVSVLRGDAKWKAEHPDEDWLA